MLAVREERDRNVADKDEKFDQLDTRRPVGLHRCRHGRRHAIAGIAWPFNGPGEDRICRLYDSPYLSEPPLPAA